jgi:hypothetical protein
LITAIPLVARAQSESEAVAATALQLTPVGALPPIVTSTLQAEVQRGVAFAIRYGYLTSSNGGPNANNGGASVVLPVGLGGTVSLTGGFFSYNCDGCQPGLMLSIGGDKRISDMVLGTGSDGSRLQFAVNGELGYGQPRASSLDQGSVVSGAVGIPVTWISGSRGRNEMRIVPFVTPGFGFGTFTGNGSPSGSAVMLGGGLGIYNPSNTVALSLGFQYIAVRNAQTQIGLSLVLGGR